MEKKYRPVNLILSAVIIFQVAFSIQLIWGYFGNAWGISWLSTYIGVIVFVELLMYNNAVEKELHPIKSAYGIIILNGCAFFFSLGFMMKAWAYSWIGLACAAVGIVIVALIDKSISKKKD